MAASEYKGRITAIRWATPEDGMTTSPASVYRKSGIMILNPAFRGRLSWQQWLFILLHEMGHQVLRSSDERAVDAWAFQQYAQMGHSLKNAVWALTDVMPMPNEEQLDRQILQYRRALAWDRKNPNHTTVMDAQDHFSFRKAFRKLQKLGEDTINRTPGAGFVYRNRRRFQKFPSGISLKNGFHSLQNLAERGINAAPGTGYVYRNRNRIRQFAPVAFADRIIDKAHFGGESHQVPVISSYDGVRDQQDHFLKGFGKAMGRFGNWTKKTGAPFALGLATMALPGPLQGIGQGLVSKLAPGEQPSNEQVVQAVQTPAQAAAVTQVMAPSLPPAAVAQIVPAMVAANSPSDARLVVSEVLKAQAEAAKTAKDAKKNYVLYGAIALVVVLVIVLLARRK